MKYDLLNNYSVGFLREKQIYDIIPLCQMMDVALKIRSGSAA